MNNKQNLQSLGKARTLQVPALNLSGALNSFGRECKMTLKDWWVENIGKDILPSDKDILSRFGLQVVSVYEHPRVDFSVLVLEDYTVIVDTVEGMSIVFRTKEAAI